MGWRTQHPYKFVMHNPNNPDGKPIEIGDDETISADDWCANLFPENYRTRKYHASTRNINEFFNDEEDSGTYIYDHSNHWEHEFFLEKIFPMDPNETYPKIVAGRRACPPEGELLLWKFNEIFHVEIWLIPGSGGPVGYIQFLNIAMDPNHPENEEKLEWLANKGYTEFDPEEFDSKKVEFKPELFS